MLTAASAYWPTGGTVSDVAPETLMTRGRTRPLSAGCVVYTQKHSSAFHFQSFGIKRVLYTQGLTRGESGDMAHLTTNPADKERFLCIYPSYINSKKTLAEGRRIAAEKAVENPSCAEIRDVLVAAGLNVLVENKMYPREWNRDVQFRGRVRIQIKLEDGSLCQEKFSNRKDVMFYAAEMIPKLKSRTQKSGGAEAGSQPGEGGKKGKKKKK